MLGRGPAECVQPFSFPWASQNHLKFSMSTKETTSDCSFLTTFTFSPGQLQGNDLCLGPRAGFPATRPAQRRLHRPLNTLGGLPPT